MEIIFSSSEELINFSKLNHKKKLNLPKYISQFVNIHIDNYKHYDELEYLYERFKNLF
jgi:hypothetical protein